MKGNLQLYQKINRQRKIAINFLHFDPWCQMINKAGECFARTEEKYGYNYPDSQITFFKPQGCPKNQEGKIADANEVYY